MHTSEHKLGLRQRLGQTLVRLSATLEQGASQLQLQIRSPRASLDRIDDLETQRFITHGAAVIVRGVGQFILR